MVDSNFVYEEGDPVDIGSHGQHDYVFSSGEKVNDGGVSTLVFESGTGLGGGLQYEVNSNGIKEIEPIATAETHSDFYGYDTTTALSAAHNYIESDVVTVLIHKNTNNGTKALVVTCHDHNSSGDYAVRMDFTESFSNTIVEDDPEGAGGDEQGNDWRGWGWSGDRTDGVVIPESELTDVTMTLDHSYSHPDRGSADGITDFRLITQDGSAPDGGNVVYAGRDGSIRVTF